MILSSDTVGDNIYRQVNLNGATTAVLSFDYANPIGVASNDVWALQVSANGGASYSTLTSFSSSSNTGAGSISIDISAFAAANTRIRFAYTSDDQLIELNIDNVKVAYASNSGSQSTSTASASSSVTVLAVNDPPVINSNGAGAGASVSIAENQAAVSTVSSTDVDGPAPVYSIAGGVDAALFTINASTGALSFVTAPDFEAPADAGNNNVYDVKVQVSDGALTDSQDIAVTVTDVIEAGITVTPTTGLVTTEAGGTAQFSVVLNSAPSANVSISVTSSRPAEAAVSTSSLTFTSSNWNIAQTITLTGLDDTLADGSQPFTVILGAAASADLNYNGLIPATVAASNSDNDSANTFYVNNSTDLSNGDTSSIAALLANDGGDGVSLREAIQAANNTANGLGGADTILFNIAGAGVHTINLLSQMDAISDSVTIDGRSQTGYSNSPLIDISGAAAGVASGLIVNANDSRLSGLAIHSFAGAAGIVLNGSSAVVRGNFIGTDASGTVLLGNAGAGVLIASSSSANTIGGSLVGEANLIAGNQSGIVTAVNAGVGNALLGNRFYGNTSLAIDLSGDGVTPNDLADADAGPNNLQNVPLLTAATTTGTQLTVSATLNSVALSNFRVELYANSAADPSGHGQGERFLGAITVSTDGAGNVTINQTLVASVAVGEWISATATNLSSNDTSEFAYNVAATAPAPAPSAPVTTVPGAIAVVPLQFASPPPDNTAAAAMATTSPSGAAANSSSTSDQTSNKLLASQALDADPDAGRRRALLAAHDNADAERRKAALIIHLTKSVEHSGHDGKTSRIMAETLRRDAEQELRLDSLGEDWLRRSDIIKSRLGWLKFDLMRVADDGSTDWSNSKSIVRLPLEAINWEPERAQSYHVVIETTQIGGVAISVGLMFYALRAGGLVAAMLTALPAWSSIDPLIVLAKKKGRDDNWSDTQQAELDADEAGVRGVIGSDDTALHS